MNHTDRIEALENLLEHFDECASIIRALDDTQLSAYDLATFEGQGAGWMGTFARDRVQAILDAAIEDIAACDANDTTDEGDCVHYVGCPHDVDEGDFDDTPTTTQGQRDGGRCPSCQVPFSQAPTSDDCPVPEQHASSFSPGERVQLVDPRQSRVGDVVLADHACMVRVVFDDGGSEILTDGDVVRANEQAASRLSALGHPGYGEAFASRVLRYMDYRGWNARQAIDHVLNAERVAVR